MRMFVFTVVNVLLVLNVLNAPPIYNTPIEEASSNHGFSLFDQSGLDDVVTSGEHDIESTMNSAQDAGESSFASLQSGLGSVFSSDSSSLQKATGSSSAASSNVEKMDDESWEENVDLHSGIDDLSSTGNQEMSTDLSSSNNSKLTNEVGLGKIYNLPTSLGLSSDSGLFDSLDSMKNQTFANDQDSSHTLEVSNGLDISSLMNTLTQNSFHPSADIDYYMDQLRNLEVKKLEFIRGMLKMMQGKADCLRAEIIGKVQRKMQAIQELMQSNGFSSNSEITNKVKNELQQVVSELSGDCPVCKALRYAMEQDESFLPLAVRLTSDIFQRQTSYYKDSSSP